MKVDKVNDHIPGYIKNEKKNNPPEDNIHIDPIINNIITTTTQNISNITNNAYTVDIQYYDVYRAKYDHPRHHKHNQPNDFRQLFRDIVNLKFDCYRRDFLVNFLNSIF